MRLLLDKSGRRIGIVLSERNAKALLEKLTWDSARTIETPNGFQVKIEPDDVHYKDRPEPIGLMMNVKGEVY